MKPSVGDRGFYGIGIVGSKTAVNVGTLWRSAGNMGAAFIFTAGRRYPHQAADTIKAWRHTPMLEFDCSDALFDGLPKGCVPVAVEQTRKARALSGFNHPERACYILGAEDTGVPESVLARCPIHIEIPSRRCLNVAVAGSIVIYDRLAKELAA